MLQKVVEQQTHPLHNLLAPFLRGPSLKIGMGSSGKVFHGSEEIMRIVFFKILF